MKLKKNFSFNSTTHDFWPIYETIKKYYPIGIRGQYPSIFYEYAGMKELDGLIAYNIRNKKNHKEIWIDFLEGLSTALDKSVENTSNGQFPCFSACINMDRFLDKNLVRDKKIHLAVSLLGGFFTLFGTDETRILDTEETKGYEIGYSSINIITASPYREFSATFQKIKQLTETKFSAYRFVPFAIHSTYIEGLQVRYSENPECTVYNALFNDYLDEYHSNNLRGDKYYGYHEWVK